LKLKYDELLSTFIFNFNLRRYSMDAGFDGQMSATVAVAAGVAGFDSIMVGRCRLTERERDASACMRRHQASALAPVRCRLTVSKSVLKAPMVSALEATM
jgi:hypothetical protein